MKKSTIIGAALLLGPLAAFLLPFMEDESEEESYEEMQARRYEEDGY